MKHGSIVIDCERMKYPYTGLYQFCRHLSLSLIKTNEGNSLCFYTPSSAAAPFGSQQCYIHQKALHKLAFPSTKNFDLWHCTHQSSGYFPFHKKIKKLLTIHDLNYLHDETKTGAKKKKFLTALQKKIEQSDAIVAVSNFSLQDVKSYIDLGDKPCAVIYNGCTIQETAIIKEPQFVPVTPFIFSIGTITDKKRFHVLPRLLPGNNLFLVIAGITQSQSYKEKILEEATRLGVTNRIHFTGPVSEKHKQWYLKNCEAFVFPSLAEGFGLPVVEAMYFGKPIVLSSAGSLPEIGGEAVSYFSSFEQDDMQESLFNCLRRFENEATLKNALHQRALSFSWDEAAKQYHRLYENLLTE